MSNGNPKLIGSNLIDAVPQTGHCPNACPECYYNRAFYRPLETPLLPTDEEARDKIVRVNSGHDSNLNCKGVIAATEGYPHKFFNTSIPQFGFPAPVVFTCNGREPLMVPVTPDVMAVRVRCNTWETAQQLELVHYYLAQGVPVIMTPTRYYQQKPPLEEVGPHGYIWREHILNHYWCATPTGINRIMGPYAGLGVRLCGTPWSSLCVDCRNCEFLYWEALRKQKGA